MQNFVNRTSANPGMLVVCTLTTLESPKVIGILGEIFDPNNNAELLVLAKWDNDRWTPVTTGAQIVPLKNCIPLPTDIATGPAQQGSQRQTVSQ